ncbi:MAG: DUF1540 domain-containing protein [Erysipelotrichaceae bacterium]
MPNKTQIQCNVCSCRFQKENHCSANEISITCDQAIMPNSTHETACKSFVCKSEK